ncbi:MAG: hypothetical protein ACXVNM_12895, partial [Bacteroidia bacterium]
MINKKLPGGRTFKKLTTKWIIKVNTLKPMSEAVLLNAIDKPAAKESTKPSEQNRSVIILVLTFPGGRYKITKAPVQSNIPAPTWFSK